MVVRNEQSLVFTTAGRVVVVKVEYVMIHPSLAFYFAYFVKTLADGTLVIHHVAHDCLIDGKLNMGRGSELRFETDGSACGEDS